MGQPFFVINQYTSSATGHVNITFDDGNRNETTYGANIPNSNNGDQYLGVQNEDRNLANGLLNNTVQRSAPVYISQSQYNEMTSLASQQAYDTLGGGHPYGLTGWNCVDFVREELQTAGITQGVSSFLTVNNPVKYMLRQPISSLS